MTAFEAKLPLYRSQNVQVLDITIGDPIDLARWAKDIGVSFPLLGDEAGQVSKQYGFYDPATNQATRAVAVVFDGELVYTERVTTTEIPSRLLPWVENVRAK